MFEWEDDEGTPDPASVDVAAQLAEAQALRLERAKELKRLEQEMNKIIDDRVSQYKAQMASYALYADQVKNAMASQQAAQEALDKAREAGHTQDIQAAKEALAAAQARASVRIKDMKDVMKAGPKLEKILESAMDKLDSGDFVGAQIEMAKLNAKLKDTESFTGDIDAGFKSVAGKLGLVAKAGDSKTFGPMIKMWGDLTKDADTLPDKLAAIGAGFSSMFGPLNIIVNILQFLIDMLFEMDEAQSRVVKSTGMLRNEFQGIMNVGLEPEMVRLNIGIKDMEKSAISLRDNFGTLIDMNSEFGKEMGRTSAMLEKAGVDMDTTQKSAKMMAQVMGGLSKKSLGEANKQFTIMIAKGKEMGMMPKKLGADFKQFFGKIKGFGGDATKEFLKLSAAAQKTGLSIDVMLGVAKKFNTFKSGADSAAELNSILGLNISAVDMMGKTAAERNETIIQSLKATTGGFDNMGKFQRLAAAEMLGFGDDVGKLAAYMDGSLAKSQEEAAKKAKSHQEAIEYITQAAKESMPAMQQMMQDFKAVAHAILPFAQVVGALAQGMQMLANGIAYLVGYIIEYRDYVMAAGAAIGLWKLWTLAKIAVDKVHLAQINAFRVSQGFATLSTQAGTVAIGQATIAQRAWAWAAAAGGVVMKAGLAIKAAATTAWTALGTAVKFAMGHIGLIIMVLAALMGVFLMSGSPQLYLIAGVMAIGVIALGFALNSMGPVAIVAALALAVLAGAIALIFHGMAAMIEQFKELMVAIPNLAVQMPILVMSFMTMVSGIMMLGAAMVATTLVMSVALVSLGLGFLFLGKMAMIASSGILMGMFSLIAMAGVMRLAGTSFKELSAIGDGVMKMGQGIAAFSAGIAGLAGAAGGLMGALGKKTLFVKHGGDGTTLIAGKTGGFMFVPPKITVDVKMPDVDMSQKVDVKVYIDGEEFRGMIHQEIAGTR